MEIEHNSRILRSRRNVQPPAKQMTPVMAKKSVSVAAIFKRGKLAPRSVALETPKLASNMVTQHASEDKAQGSRSTSRFHSPHKAGSRVLKKKPNLHPLAEAFKETSDSYRRHLYTTTTLKINNTLASLTTALYDNSLQVVTSDANTTHNSPIRLTFPTKFQRAALKIYQPISAYRVGLTHTNTDGTQTKFVATLESRMADYADMIATQKAEIEKLREKWETIVGEIWKVGVQCLGEETMEAMLFTKKARLEDIDEEKETTLFVREHGSPTAKPKKRVTFAAAADEDEDEQALRLGPLHFLYQPTRLRVGPVPDGPEIPVQDIAGLEKKINDLGQKEYEEMKKAEKDYKVYWKKKNERLAQVLGED